VTARPPASDPPPPPLLPRCLAVEGPDGRRTIAWTAAPPPPPPRPLPRVALPLAALGFPQAPPHRAGTWAAGRPVRGGAAPRRAPPAGEAGSPAEPPWGLASPGDPAEAPPSAELRARRLALGLSQREAARLAGCFRSQVAHAETGTRPALAARRRLAAALDALEAAYGRRGAPERAAGQEVG
jgi:hypothetical protein